MEVHKDGRLVDIEGRPDNALTRQLWDSARIDNIHLQDLRHPIADSCWMRDTILVSSFILQLAPTILHQATDIFNGVITEIIEVQRVFR